MKPSLYFYRQLHAYSGKKLYFNLLGTVFISFFEGIGIFLLIPIINLSGMLNINTTTIPFVNQIHISQLMPRTLGLPILLLAYVLIITAQAFCKRQLSIQNTKIFVGFINLIRMETYRSLLEADWMFFLRKRKSDLINLLTKELTRITSGAHLFLQLLSSIIFTLIQIGIAFWLSPKIAVFVIISGSLLAVFSRKFIKTSRVLGHRTSENAESYMAGITDHFNGIKDIKSNRLEASRYEWLRDWCQKIELEQLSYAKLKFTSQLIYKITSIVLIVFLIYFTLMLFKGQTGQLLLIILIFTRLWPRFTTIQSNLEQISASVPAFEKLISLQEETKRSSETRGSMLDNDQEEPIWINQGIECRNVNFRYNVYQSTYALQDINLHIPANQMTAVVGRSGAGKSTLIDIVMGLIQPENGEVLADGIPIEGDTRFSLRRSLSYVAQDPFLFNASIRENLLIVQPNATEADIGEALKFSAAEFVHQLPQGLDTVIGDRGVRLSGGERQRLVLARAILRKPSVLVLDEATSSLDTENEAKIQEALERIRGRMTIIVIAHRLSTIRHADQVIVLDEGKVIQKGRFNQLANQSKGVFQLLLKNQMELNESYPG